MSNILDNFMSILRGSGSLVFSLIMGIAAGAVVMEIVGVNPLNGYAAILTGAFGDPIHIGQTLTRMTPILLIALGTTVAFRTGVWNIGQDGQFYLGALAAAWIGVQFASLPSYVLVGATLLGGFFLGGMWSGLAGYFKAKFEMDEIVTTLMMNFIAVLLVSYLAGGPMKDPRSATPASAPVGLNSRLPFIIPSASLSTGFIIAFVAAPLVYLLIWKTTTGYRLRAVGMNSKAARHGGISAKRAIIIAMLISGGLCGIAGAIEITSVQYRIFVGISPGYWIMGIMAALLGKLHAVGAVPASLFIAALFIGADEMARATGVSTFLVPVIQGVIILLVLMTENIGWFNRRVKDLVH